jgi:cyanate permease
MFRISPLSLAILGSALIALSFGLSRFAFGLFVPTIRESLLLSPTIIGLVAAQAYTGFALASVFASRLAARFGARRLASTATVSLCAGFLIGITGDRPRF